MPRSKRGFWVVLVALILVAINWIPTGVNQEIKPGIETISASAALVQVEGLLRNFSHFNLNKGPGELLVRASSTFFSSRDVRFLRHFGVNWNGKPSASTRMKAESRGYFIPVMVIGMFFAFYQCSRSKSGIDGFDRAVC